MKRNTKGENSAVSHNIPKARQAVKILFANPAFQKEVEKLRRKWGLETDNFDRDENREKVGLRVFVRFPDAERQRKMEENRARSTRPDAQFQTDIIELIRQFHLDKEYWLTLIWEYVRMGTFDEKRATHNVIQLDSAPFLRLEKQQGTGKTKILMEIGENTTLKDVKNYWYIVEATRKHLSPHRAKFKEWKNFERDSRIYSLYAEGKTTGEIWRQIKTEFKNQDDLEFGNIKKIVSTYRKRFELPKGDKLITSSTKTNTRVNTRRLR